MLIIFGGLPGTGKSSIAKLLCRELGAFYLRIDSLEQALVNSGLVKSAWDLGPAGYLAAYAIAEDNLRLGRTLVADSVNPLEITRADWRGVAVRTCSPFLEVEIICSDKQEHRRRVEGRQPEIPGLKLPDWQAVESREYQPWNSAGLVLDTAKLSPEAAVAEIMAELNDVANRQH